MLRPSDHGPSPESEETGDPFVQEGRRNRVGRGLIPPGSLGLTGGLSPACAVTSSDLVASPLRLDLDGVDDLFKLGQVLGRSPWEKGGEDHETFAVDI